MLQIIHSIAFFPTLLRFFYSSLFKANKKRSLTILRGQLQRSTWKHIKCEVLSSSWQLMPLPGDTLCNFSSKLGKHGTPSWMKKSSEETQHVMVLWLWCCEMKNYGNQHLGLRNSHKDHFMC